MASSPPYTNEEETLHSTPTFRRSAIHRTPSFSSLSPSNSSDSSFKSSSFFLNEEFHSLSPMSTPLYKFKGVPFSWEQIPGIPKKHQGSKKNNNMEYSEHLLPLPPAGTTASATKKPLHQEEISPKKSTRFQMDDPFFAALVECSKDDHHHHGSNLGSKITRSLSDRFGFINIYSSCKRTCQVSESIVYLPRPSPHYLLNRRSS